MGRGGGGGVMMYTVLQPDILNEIEYLVFHNYNFIFVVDILFPLEFTFYLSDQFSLLIYLCLLPSSATVKMDNGENMENARYAMNDDTAGFINQKKNRNTSTKTEYVLKLMKNYFASIYAYKTLLHHIPYQAMVSENDQLSQIRIKEQTVV